MHKNVSEEIDLDRYKKKAKEYGRDEILDLSREERDSLLKVGYDISEKERSGSYIQIDQSSFCPKNQQEGIEIMSIGQALERYSWLREYLWNAVKSDADIYTKEVSLSQIQGYFIHAFPRVKSKFPVQSCLFVSEESSTQLVHNIIIAEEGSEMDIITGCSVAHEVNSALHLGISEFYVKPDARISFTMIHNWKEGVEVRPRTGIKIDENGVFVNNYICMNPVKNLQMYPTAFCGKNSTATFQSVLCGYKDSKMDVGSRVFLLGEDSRTEIISRAIAKDESEITARGNIIGRGRDVRGHLECRGLMLSDLAKIYAVPELEADISSANLSHEAAVGKIKEEEIEYLTSRGLSEDEATSTIVRGFLNVDIKGLPSKLNSEIKEMVRLSAEAI